MVCLVQCTSPFVTEEFLRGALKTVGDGEHDAVFSVTRSGTNEIRGQ